MPPLPHGRGDRGAEPGPARHAAYAQPRTPARRPAGADPARAGDARHTFRAGARRRHGPRARRSGAGARGALDRRRPRRREQHSGRRRAGPARLPPRHADRRHEFARIRLGCGDGAAPDLCAAAAHRVVCRRARSHLGPATDARRRAAAAAHPARRSARVGDRPAGRRSGQCRGHRGIPARGAARPIGGLRLRAADRAPRHRRRTPGAPAGHLQRRRGQLLRQPLASDRWHPHAEPAARRTGAGRGDPRPPHRPRHRAAPGDLDRRGRLDPTGARHHDRLRLRPAASGPGRHRRARRAGVAGAPAARHRRGRRQRAGPRVDRGRHRAAGAARGRGGPGRVAPPSCSPTAPARPRPGAAGGREPGQDLCRRPPGRRRRIVAGRTRAGRRAARAQWRREDDDPADGARADPPRLRQHVSVR